MSACRTMELRLAAYADDELDVAAAAEVETHLGTCAACRSHVEAERAFTRALRDLHPRPEPPEDLADRVRGALFARFRWPRAFAGAALAASLALVTALPFFLGHSSGVPASVREAADTHHRANAGDVAIDFASADSRAVHAWLGAALPFAAGLPNAPSPAIRVEGATRTALGGEPAGLVRYRIGDRFASLFLLAHPSWADDGRSVRLRGIEFRIFEESGLTLVAWSHPPLSYLLVSEGPATLGEACGVCHGNDRQPMTDFAAALAASDV